MKRYTINQIRDFISCPEFGDDHYGKWGSLRKEVRFALYYLITTNETLEQYVKMWEELKEYIEKYENENEIAYIIQQIEENYFEGDDNNEDNNI